MAELYFIREDQQRADEFVYNEMPVAPRLGQMQFCREQWQLVKELATRSEVAEVPSLTPHEKPWLTRLGATVDELFSYELNTMLARTASHVIALDGKLAMSPHEAGAVVYARSAFLGKVLGWGAIGDASPSLKHYFSTRSQEHPAHVPLGSFITAHKLIAETSISVSAMIHKWGDILDIDASKVQRVMQGGMVENARPDERLELFMRAYAAQ